MAGGGKGGSQTSEMSVPDWVEQPARRNLARAEEISQLGYVPYGGPEVAAFNDRQNMAFRANNDMASAYGMPTATGNGMPVAQTFANGVRGYSSMPLYRESVAQLRDSRPGQYGAIMDQFIDPYTGASPIAQTAATTAQQAQVAQRVPDNAELGGPESPAGWGSDGPPDGGMFGGGGIGGYSGLGDMMDGSGPGASGGAFQGGGRVSDVANGVTGRGPEGGNGGGGVK